MLKKLLLLFCIPNTAFSMDEANRNFSLKNLAKKTIVAHNSPYSHEQIPSDIHGDIIAQKRLALKALEMIVYLDKDNHLKLPKGIEYKFFDNDRKVLIHPKPDLENLDYKEAWQSGNANKRKPHRIIYDLSNKEECYLDVSKRPQELPEQYPNNSVGRFLWSQHCIHELYTKSSNVYDRKSRSEATYLSDELNFTWHNKGRFRDIKFISDNQAALTTASNSDSSEDEFNSSLNIIDLSDLKKPTCARKLTGCSIGDQIRSISKDKRYFLTASLWDNDQSNVYGFCIIDTENGTSIDIPVDWKLCDHRTVQDQVFAGDTPIALITGCRPYPNTPNYYIDIYQAEKINRIYCEESTTEAPSHLGYISFDDAARFVLFPKAGTIWHVDTQKPYVTISDSDNLEKWQQLPYKTFFANHDPFEFVLSEDATLLIAKNLNSASLYVLPSLDILSDNEIETLYTEFHKSEIPNNIELIKQKVIQLVAQKKFNTEQTELPNSDLKASL